ncbi:MAG: Amidohydrolase, partial [Acidimicrobiia bacterium]|nr:Amidohydrolase [Acidimicrobiia bacterium]
MSTSTEPTVVASKLGYGISDADQHFYEAPDAVTKYLDPAYRDAFRWVDVDGRKMLLLNDRLYRLIPNPTYDPVARPGSMVEYFRGHNPEGKSLKELAGPQMALDPAFRFREPRMKVLDSQGVDLCIMLPTQALGLEEMLWEDPAAMVACVRSLNRWIFEEWTWNTDNRVLTTGVITLIDPDAAVKELDLLIEQGCRVVGMRPGPVKTPNFRRSIGDPVYDPFWARAADAGVVIGMHAADTPYGGYLEAWGESGRWLGHKASPLAEIMGIHTERTIYDTMAAAISHGVFDRHPTLKVAVLELGAGWVPELVRRMKVAYGKTPQNFTQDPVQSFYDHVWVMPFYEDSLIELTRHFPVDKIIYGSDWPHPEGLADPEEYIGDLNGFTP